MLIVARNISTLCKLVNRNFQEKESCFDWLPRRLVVAQGIDPERRLVTLPPKVWLYAAEGVKKMGCLKHAWKGMAIR
jgi:hypothetical protein